MAFLRVSDRVVCSKILEDLNNNFLKWKYSYPKTVAGVWILIRDYSQFYPYTLPSGGEGVYFSSVYGGERKDKSDIKCHACGGNVPPHQQVPIKGWEHHW